MEREGDFFNRLVLGTSTMHSNMVVFDFWLVEL
jgi:hypothetical protein